jgi:hypothetical protein
MAGRNDHDKFVDADLNRMKPLREPWSLDEAEPGRTVAHGGDDIVAVERHNVDVKVPLLLSQGDEPSGQQIVGDRKTGRDPHGRCGDATKVLDAGLEVTGGPQYLPREGGDPTAIRCQHGTAPGAGHQLETHDGFHHPKPRRDRLLREAEPTCGGAKASADVYGEQNLHADEVWNVRSWHPESLSHNLAL